MDQDKSFRLWKETLFDRIGPVEQKRIDDAPFEGLIQFVDVGDLRITRLSESALQTEVTPTTLRRRDNTGSVFVLMQLAGVSTSSQDGRDAVQRAGDIVVLGGRPNVHVSSRTDRSFVLELPRERLEDTLGPTRLYTALTVGGDSAVAGLAMNFLIDLVGVSDRLDPDAAMRMSRIGVDLILSGIAERMARDVPRSLHGTVVVQRAKAYVEANLGDPTLDPPQLAAAVGVSLRRLQELFHDHGRHIADWIWERRLEAAARQLNDPASNHVAVSAIACACGFSSPAHFARRFKDRYGLTPSEFRQAAGPHGS
ncbi:helix-turn-helix domain-containing protein [Methylobacterium trifolii]